MADGPGAWGPYARDGRWLVIIRSTSGERTSRSFTSKAAAEACKRDYAAEIDEERQQERTVATTIDAYTDHLKAKGNRPSSYNETPRRLRLFFATDLEAPLVDLTARHCGQLYTKLTKATYERGGAQVPYSVDTHRNILAEARSFLAWCVDRRWLRTNPLAAVKGKGRRRHGKPQLTIDEARRWDRAALKLAPHEPGALAALLTVRLGLRASEITQRLVRDLDDKGRLLRVTAAKTAAGVRVVEVSTDLRPLLVELARGRESGDRLFGEHWRDWVRKWVRKICVAAKVPLVTAHGMRGLHATLAMQAGATAHLVAAALGHESETTTLESYADASAVDRQKRKASMKVLKGGK